MTDPMRCETCSYRYLDTHDSAKCAMLGGLVNDDGLCDGWTDKPLANRCEDCYAAYIQFDHWNCAYYDQLTTPKHTCANFSDATAEQKKLRKVK